MEHDSLTRVLKLAKILTVVGSDTDEEANKTRDLVFKSLVKESHDLGRKRLLAETFTAREQKAYSLANTLLGAKPVPVRRTIADKYADPPFNTFLKKPFGPRAEAFLRKMREDLGLHRATAGETAEETVLKAACSCSRMRWLAQAKDGMCDSCWEETMSAVFQTIARACVIVARRQTALLREKTKISARDLGDICESMSADLAKVRVHCRQVVRRNVDWLTIVDDMFHILVRILNVLTLKVGFQNQK